MQFNAQTTHHHCPVHMSSIRPPPPRTTTSYIHLCPHVNRKPILHGATQRKYSHPYRKFQAGTTTTFSGYTNISNYMNKNYLEKNPQSNKNQNNNKNNNIPNNTNSLPLRLPSLMSLDCFQQPPRKNRRNLQHAEQCRNQAPIIISRYESETYRSLSRSNKFTGIVLSDSMCKYIRADNIGSKDIQVRISFESGCDCVRMLNYLEQQNIQKNFILQSNFVVFSLCTNDVANLGPNLAIQHCRSLIQRTRQLFPRLRSIGWLALSPRQKPFKLYNFFEIGKKHKEFNQLLKSLSNEMNFQIINANLRKEHMHRDGLHPCIQSGRILIENAIKSWFSEQKNTFSVSNLENFYQQDGLSRKSFNHPNFNNQRRQQHRYQYQPKQQQQQQQQQQYRCECQPKQQQQQQQKYQYNYRINTNRNNNNNNNNNVYQSISSSNQRRQQRQQKNSQETQYQSSKVLINRYPHFLRHKEEFYRKITIPVELENYKENIFHLSNTHYQTEYFKLEAEKWKIYMKSAMNKDNNNNNKNHREQVETIIIDDNDNNNSIPIARPSPNGLVGLPAPLDFSEYSEFFDEWLPEPTPGQKRKIGQRRDDPPTPPSPRQPPPPVIPRRTLPPRDVNIPLVRRSFHVSFSSNEKKDRMRRQHSFNALLPLEKQDSNESNNNNIENREEREKQSTTTNVARESSMIISPIRSSTPELTIKSPSVVQKHDIKTTTSTHMTFDCRVIPIETRYFFKRTKQRCTFENIEAHLKSLEQRYKLLEDDRENKLKSLFPEHKYTQVTSLVKKIVEKVLEKKQIDDQRRLDNLILDHKREKALQTIRNIGNESEQQYTEILREKFQRTLDLKLQLDKLEKRFVENMPPPSLNILDKLQLYAKQLKPNDKNLSSLREQWKNVLRKTKLELTTLMRRAKLVELEQANEEYDKLKTELPERLREPYDTICYVIRTRHNRITKRKLNFLAKRACATNEN